MLTSSRSTSILHEISPTAHLLITTPGENNRSHKISVKSAAPTHNSVARSFLLGRLSLHTAKAALPAAFCESTALARYITVGGGDVATQGYRFTVPSYSILCIKLEGVHPIPYSTIMCHYHWYCQPTPPLASGYERHSKEGVLLKHPHTTNNNEHAL